VGMVRKNAVVLSVIFALCIAVVGPVNVAARGVERWVSPAGDDGGPGTRERPWRTLARAAKAVGPGDTVLLMSGTWAERLIPTRSGTADAPLVFAAAPGATPVIDGQAISLKGMSGVVQLENLSWIELRGISVRNSGPDGNAAGIFARRCSHIAVVGCRTAGTNSSGIGIWFSSSVLVDGNDVTDACRDGSQECITVAGCDGFEIRGNVVHDCVNGKSGGEGIDAKHSARGKIHGNVVHHTRRLGIYVDAWDFHMVDVEVYDNLVYETQSNGYALAAEDNGTLENVRFHDNVAFRNAHVGLTLADWGEKVPHHGLKDIIVEHNTFIENGKGWGGGIRIDNAEAEGIVVRDNLVANNGSGQIIVDKKPKSLVIAHNFVTAPGEDEKGETAGERPVVGVPRYRFTPESGLVLEPGSPGEGFGAR